MNAHSIKIRPATIDDFENILILNSQVMAAKYDYDEDAVIDFEFTVDGKKYFHEALINPQGCFLVATSDNKLVGYVNGAPMPISYRKSKYFELQNLGVIPEDKRQGVGKKLMTAITDWAKTQGFQKIYLNCYANNTEALAFYRQLGYQDIDICLERSII
jgi:ribosomal protein S18 acetylase RimI-like enzyme